MSKLINCKDCGHAISKNAEACPNCGAKVKRTSILTWVAAIFIGLMVLSAVLAAMSDDVVDTQADTSSSNQIEPLVALDNSNENVAPETQPVKSNWEYDESIDEMRGTTSYTAIAMSKNDVYLDSPYGGGTNLGVIVRNSDELGNEVLFVTNNGQLWCEYSDCIMSVKFDDEDVGRYSISRAAGGSSDAMFLNDSEGDFIDKLKKSKVMMIEIGFFNNGNKQFTFNVTDLDWQH